MATLWGCLRVTVPENPTVIRLPHHAFTQTHAFSLLLPFRRVRSQVSKSRAWCSLWGTWEWLAGPWQRARISSTPLHAIICMYFLYALILSQHPCYGFNSLDYLDLWVPNHFFPLAQHRRVCDGLVSDGNICPLSFSVSVSSMYPFLC